VNTPADEYVLEEITCKSGQTWYTMDGSGFRFNIFEGQIAVMEPLQVQVTKKLLRVTSSPGPKEQHDMIKSTLKDLRPLNGKNIVSAYTQRPVTDAVYVIDKTKYDRGGLMLVNGSKEVLLQDVAEMGYTYDKCGREEAQKNKLRIGLLELVGHYEKGILKNLEVTKRDHLYSSAYENCVRLKVADYVPQINERLREVYAITDKFELTFRF
jgi:hypothetical protein